MQPMLPGIDEGKLHAMVSDLRYALKKAYLSAQQSAVQVRQVAATLPLDKDRPSCRIP